MPSYPKMAALIHNEGMEPTLRQGSVAIADYPNLKVKRWTIIAYRSELSVKLATHIAMRDSAAFEKLGKDATRKIYEAHFSVFGALRINRVGRVVGLPKERIRLASDGVYINGKRVKLPKHIASIYGKIPAEVVKTLSKDLEIPDHQIFLLQDNLVHGNDSRSLGTVKLTSFLGALSDLVTPKEVRDLIAEYRSSGRTTARVPVDLIRDLEEQHGPVDSWAKP